MLGHCWHRTRMTAGLAETYIATCDQEIMDYAASIGAKAIMTADSHTRATDRTAEALIKAERDLGSTIDAVIMVQGDEPLLMPGTLETMLAELGDPSLDIVNLMEILDTDEEFRSEHNVKVVTNRAGDALYFSREPIPSSWKKTPGLPMRKQTGIIAFKRDALLQFNNAAETILEQCESVDMNRVLENGGRIRMVLSTTRTVGVDTPADLATAERLMNLDHLFPIYGQQ